MTMFDYDFKCTNKASKVVGEHGKLSSLRPAITNTEPNIQLFMP